MADNKISFLHTYTTFQSLLVGKQEGNIENKRLYTYILLIQVEDVMDVTKFVWRGTKVKVVTRTFQFIDR